MSVSTTSSGREPPPDTAYEMQQLLGQGGFARVWQGTHTASGNKVAVKVYTKASLKNKVVRNMVNTEVRVLNQLGQGPPHDNVVSLHTSFENHRGLHLVQDLCERGSLFAFVRKQRFLGEDTARYLFRQILSGLAHVHGSGVVHRDVKLENLLFATGNSLKLVDFGLASGKAGPFRAKCGSFLYMAPEIHRGEEYRGQAVDMWAAGVVLWVMLAGYFPFNGHSEMEVRRKVVSTSCTMLPHFSPGVVSLLKKLLAKDGGRRPSAVEALEDPWVTAPLPDGFEPPKVGHALVKRAERLAARRVSLSRCSSTSSESSAASVSGVRGGSRRRPPSAPSSGAGRNRIRASERPPKPVPTASRPPASSPTASSLRPTGLTVDVNVPSVTLASSPVAQPRGIAQPAPPSGGKPRSRPLPSPVATDAPSSRPASTRSRDAKRPPAPRRRTPAHRSRSRSSGPSMKAPPVKAPQEQDASLGDLTSLVETRASTPTNRLRSPKARSSASSSKVKKVPPSPVTAGRAPKASPAMKRSMQAARAAYGPTPTTPPRCKAGRRPPRVAAPAAPPSHTLVRLPLLIGVHTNSDSADVPAGVVLSTPPPSPPVCNERSQPFGGATAFAHA